MPSNKPYLYNDPQFSEYVFYCMASATQEQRNNLNVDELKHFKNKKAMRRFAEDASNERKDFMLARLGIMYAKIYQPLESLNVTDEVLQEAKFQYINENRPQIIKKMFEGKIFFTGTRDVILSCQMAIQNSHSQIYQPDYTLPKLQQALIEANLTTANEAFKDGIKAFETLCKVFLALEACKDDIDSICGLSAYEIKVLMAIFPYRNTFMSANAIAIRIHENIRQQVKKRGVARVANAMAQKEYVLSKMEKGTGGKYIYSYTITGKGIDAVGKYIRYILSEAK